MVIYQDTVRDWLIDCRIAGKAPSSLRLYERVARSYTESCEGQVTRATLRGWLADLDGKSDATRRVYLAIAKLYCKWLHDEELTEEDAGQRLRIPKVKPNVITPFTADEVSRLIRAVEKRPRDLAILRVLISSGMRVSECAGILTENVDLDQQRVLVLGKGGKWRLAPIDLKAAQAVSRYMRRERGKSPLAADPRLWLAQRGPLSAQGVQVMVRQAGRAAGVDDVHCHRFRHSFASAWLSAGGSEGGLMTVAGWKSREMLYRYSAATASERALDEYKRLRSR